MQFQRYKEGLRTIPPTFKMTINTEWLESYLMSGCDKKDDGSKWTYEDIRDEELFRMDKSRCKKQGAKR